MSEKIVRITEIDGAQFTALITGLQAEIKELKDKINPNVNRLLDRAEVIEMLGVKPTTLHNWAQKEILKPKHIGGRVYFKYTDILNIDGDNT